MAAGDGDPAQTDPDPGLEPTLATNGETISVTPAPGDTARRDPSRDPDALGATVAAEVDADAEGVLPEAAPERYQLADEIGRGGLGAVVRARDRHLGRQVAIKALHAEG